MKQQFCGWRGLWAVAALSVVSGCQVPINPELPAQTKLATEPETGSEYYLYVPSAYRPERRWPLVVTCHGTVPWDTAKFQVDEWSPLAEEEDFIVVAPKLKGTRGDFVPAPEKQISLQRKDEQTILAAVRHVEAAYNVAEDEVFITGWSAGGYAVLFTGLRNPDVFRALALRQGAGRSKNEPPRTVFRSAPADLRAVRFAGHSGNGPVQGGHYLDARAPPGRVGA